MSAYTRPERDSTRYLSDADVRVTHGAGTMDLESSLSHIAAEYTASSPAALGSLSRYDREEVKLTTKRQAQQLLSLRAPGWDSYGARPTSPEALDRAVDFVLHLVDYEVAAPRLYPLSDGGVRLEWAGPDGEIWIDVAASREASAFFADERMGEEWEGPLADAPDRLLVLLASMH